MKKIVLVSLIAMSAIPGAAGATDTPRERQFCTRIETRSGSHMAYRRVCRTAEQWRQALGADWRQHISGARDVQNTMDGVAMRSARQSNPAIAPSSD